MPTQGVTQVSICNQALGWLGANLITSLDDETSTEAKLCKANFEPLKQVVLEENEWSFATARKRLTALTGLEAQNWEPLNAFVVPANTVRVLQVSDDGRFFSGNQPIWELEDNKVLVERYEAIYIRYLYNAEDVASFSPSFVQAFAARLAMDLAAPITNSPEMVQLMTELYGGKLSNAAATDSLQGTNRRIRSRWMKRSRIGGGSGGAIG